MSSRKTRKFFLSLKRPGLAALLAWGVTLVSQNSSAAEPVQFTWHTDALAGTAELRLGEQPVVRYMFAHDFTTPARRTETYKVFHHVFGPGTKTLITKGAGGEYTHHRGIFLGFSQTRYGAATTDFWHCKEETAKVGGCQQHVKFLEQRGTAETGNMTAEIGWVNASEQTVVSEERTVAVRKLPVETAPGYGWQIDVVSRLKSLVGPVTLAGDRQHAGLQFRAAQVVADEKSARYVRPAGFPETPQAVEVDDHKDPNGHINLHWLAMTYPVESQTYTVQYCEDPSLPQPSRFSERPYGRFGAYFTANIEPQKPFVMKYRLIVTAGLPAARDVLQRRYAVFAKELAANPQK